MVQATGATFPYPAAGHPRQNRFFLEAELTHTLDRLVKEGVGPFNLLNDLPFRITDLGYDVTFRAEADGIYDLPDLRGDDEVGSCSGCASGP